MIEYFDGYGRADALRLMCAMGKVDFKSHAISQEEWIVLKLQKELYPGGGLPVAVVQGRRMHQTMPIMRYLALSTGYYPELDLHAWACDSMMDVWSGTMDAMGGAMFAKEGDEEPMKKFLQSMDRMLEIATERMEKHNWSYSSGNKLSCADILIASYHFNII